MDLFDPHTYANVRKPLLEAETLPPACYTSEEFFQKEVENIFMKVWNFVGRADTISKPGDYTTLDFVGVPLLIVRGEDNEIRAFVNSCRHRGAKVVTGKGSATGAAKGIKCGYHGWIYKTDGQLAACPGMANSKDFDKKDYPLKSVNTATWAGFDMQQSTIVVIRHVFLGVLATLATCQSAFVLRRMS